MYRLNPGIYTELESRFLKSVGTSSRLQNEALNLMLVPGCAQDRTVEAAYGNLCNSVLADFTDRSACRSVASDELDTELSARSLRAQLSQIAARLIEEVLAARSERFDSEQLQENGLAGDAVMFVSDPIIPIIQMADPAPEPVIELITKRVTETALESNRESMSTESSTTINFVEEEYAPPDEIPVRLNKANQDKPNQNKPNQGTKKNSFRGIKHIIMRLLHPGSRIFRSKAPMKSSAHCCPDHRQANKFAHSEATAHFNNNSTKLGQKIADAAAQIARQMNTRGWCAKGVETAFAKLGIHYSGNAKDTDAFFDRDSRFKRLKSGEAPQVGDVCVMEASPGHPWGHTFVFLGNGLEASDHIAPVTSRPDAIAKIYRMKDAEKANG